MRSLGQVVFVSKRGMIVVQHEKGYSVVELLGNEDLMEIHDPAEGDWDHIAGEPLFVNGRNIEAYFQGTWGKLDAAIKFVSDT